MRTGRTTRALILVLVVILGPADTASNPDKHAGTLVVFTAEEGLKLGTVALPSEVWRYLRVEEGNRACFQQSGGGPDIRPDEWFAAAVVPLSASAAHDVLVVPKHPCLAGANVTRFWVFHDVHRRYKLVLAGAGFAIELLDGSSRGLRDIQVTSFTAEKRFTLKYSYDGSRYVAGTLMKDTIGKTR
jgi:hypothetical protein